MGLYSRELADSAHALTRRPYLERREREGADTAGDDVTVDVACGKFVPQLLGHDYPP